MQSFQFTLRRAGGIWLGVLIALFFLLPSPGDAQRVRLTPDVLPYLTKYKNLSSVGAACLRLPRKAPLFGRVRKNRFSPLHITAVNPRKRVLSLRLLAAKEDCVGFTPPATQTHPWPPAAVPIPELTNWQRRMIVEGTFTCQELRSQSAPFERRLAHTYYDAQFVFMQIADYTGDASWLDCAEAAEQVYRDKYLLKYRARIPGYWLFPRGLALDHLRTGDPESRRALREILQRAAFVKQAPDDFDTRDARLSREVAYGILAWLAAEDVGEPRSDRLASLVSDAFAHFDQWFVKENADFVRPFMVALSSHALIRYYERSFDPQVIPTLTRAADWLWDRTWLPKDSAFMYTDRSHSSGGTEPAPDLNLLIAPLYAWLYYQTGEIRFLERGDAIFAGGVQNGSLNNPKHFNQNYYWSFEYEKWRSLR